MARHIIVLIGSVTSEQYKPIRLEMLRRGIKPVIKRYEGFEELFSAESFYHSDEIFASRTDAVEDVEASEVAFVIYDSHQEELSGQMQDALERIWSRPIIDVESISSTHMMLNESLEIMDDKLEFKNPNFLTGSTFERF
jgi:hypothetical protein